MAAERRAARLAAGWLAAGWVVGCGGGEPEPPPEDPNIPLVELCAELAEADCARLEACGALYAPFDLAACEARQAAVMCGPTQAALTAAVESGSLDYFELAARDCKAAIEGLGCEVGYDHDPLVPAACRAMVTARGTEGDACYLGFDCAEGFYCDDGAACPGRCAPLLGNNQPCSFGERCADDLYCDVTAMRCLSRTDLGGTCALALSGNPCVDGAFCDRSNPAAPACVRARGRNEGCNSDAECAQGALCIGNRCSAGLEGDACAEAFHCAPELRCVSGRCRAPGALDDACDPAGVPCGAGLTCTSTQSEVRCRPQLAPGVSCGEDTPACLLGRCAAGVCAAALEDGAACADPIECLPGRACEGGRCAPVPRDCRR